ncbi:MAG: tRNA-intron lyase [Candidatus Pacearchaeota archaeon]|nr:tRNA-intron lyase [Candidatus Pacearchaeota archaeon]
MQEKKKIKAIFVGEIVTSNTQEAFELYEKSRFGELVDGKIHYPLVEALYLMEKGKMEVYEGRKKLTPEKFLEKAKKMEPNFWHRFRVFSDIRNRGYIIKTALKFGADFRVYGRGVKPGEKHAKWILFPVHETSGLTWYEFAAKTRVAHSTKKRLLIGIVDNEGDVTYYEIKWLKP